MNAADDVVRIARRGKARATGFVVAAIALAACAFLFLLARAERLPEGPVAIAWDREACAHCRMHIGDKRFAAQIQEVDGRVLNFDDPGCLFLYVGALPDAKRAVYFRHHTDDRWLAREAAAFVSAPASPMGLDLGAVDRTTPGATSYEDALALAHARRREREAAR